MTRALHRLAAAVSPVVAAPPHAADGRVGKARPITRERTCANGPIVPIKFQPRRPNEYAWLTYLAKPVAVTRRAAASGIAYTCAAASLRRHDSSGDGSLEFAGLPDAPFACSRQPNK